MRIFIFLLFCSPTWAQTSLQVNLGEPRSICLGTYLKLHAKVSGGQAPYTYEWQPIEGLSATNTEKVIATPVSNTFYTVTVHDAQGNVATNSIEITVHPRQTLSVAPTINIEPGETALLNVHATGGSGNYTYCWQPTRWLDDSTISTPTTKPQTPITYTILVTDSNGCIKTERVSINIVAKVRTVSKED
jgi:SprB repeat